MLLGMCEELSPTDMCLRHLCHTSLVCSGHHYDTSKPLRAELLIHILSTAQRALKASVVSFGNAHVNKGVLQSECNSWLHRNNTAIDY